jgi:hypothetical protein
LRRLETGDWPSKYLPHFDGYRFAPLALRILIPLPPIRKNRWLVAVPPN